MLRAPGSGLSRTFLLGGAAAGVLCGFALAACGSRTGFLDGDGVGGALRPDDDATGDAGSAGSNGSAGGSGLGLAGSSMIGAGGSVSQAPPSVDEPPPDRAEGCANGGTFEGDVVIFSAADFAQLEGCTVVRGDLQIRARVADLRPLRSLREVTGTLGIVRGPASLEGLENLREVQELDINSLVPASLQPLAGLQRIRTLSIRGEMRQADLNGLGGFVNLRELNIERSTLRSLAGLAVPLRMSAISIVNSFTSDLSALSGVSQIDQGLTLSGVSGLVTLDALSSLGAVGSLNIAANPDLVHIDGIGDVAEVEEISVTGNPRLEHLPGFDAVRFAEVVLIAGNAELRNVPRLGGAERIEQVRIEGNPSLERIVFPALGAIDGSITDSALGIIGNRVLTEFSAPALQSAYNLLIADNPQLTTIALPALQSVPQRLTVVLNPAVPSAGLGSVLTATTSVRKLGANQGEAPLVICPYTSDDRCDETSQVCAVGSDLVDCRAGYPPW